MSQIIIFPRILLLLRLAPHVRAFETLYTGTLL
jgi:hypothetical protein